MYQFLYSLVTNEITKTLSWCVFQVFAVVGSQNEQKIPLFREITYFTHFMVLQLEISNLGKLIPPKQSHKSSKFDRCYLNVNAVTNFLILKGIIRALI